MGLHGNGHEKFLVMPFCLVFRNQINTEAGGLALRFRYGVENEKERQREKRNVYLHVYDFKKTHSTFSYYGNLFPCLSKGVVEEGEGEASRLSLRFAFSRTVLMWLYQGLVQGLLMEPAYEIG